MDSDAFTTGEVNRISAAAAVKVIQKYLSLPVPWQTLFVVWASRQLHGNDTGLGENSRMGMLIIPKHGPRVRIPKIITEKPLLTDNRISFGDREFCEICARCRDGCPGGCIPVKNEIPESTFDSFGVNNITWVKKWPVQQERCHIR